ncbi:hypothetical protein [Rhodovibrio salinarum]|uniref:hypothetical protein n=1 Tax=Rhodovibrio salinarum TaxID=1087 RepID=UPI0012DC0295|nr:hypothetical protein [Rhodovibrio salinarum]
MIEIIAFIKEFQNLMTGILAIIGACITAFLIYKSTHISVRAERQKQEREEVQLVNLRCLELAEDLSLISKRAKNGCGTIRAAKAENAQIGDKIKARMKLSPPDSTKDWKFMSLIDQDLARAALKINSLIYDHNFDLDRSGGAFGDDNFGRQMSERLSDIQGKSRHLSQKIHENRPQTKTPDLFE